MEELLFTVSVTALLGSDCSNPVALLDTFALTLVETGFIDAAITASDIDVGFTAQVYANDAFTASEKASQALYLLGSERIMNMTVDPLIDEEIIYDSAADRLRTATG